MEVGHESWTGERRRMDSGLIKIDSAAVSDLRMTVDQWVNPLRIHDPQYGQGSNT